MSFSEPVLMTGLINITQEVSAAGAALKKTSGGDSYNATATSLEYIESLQSPCRGVKWTMPDAWGSFHLGLTSTTGFSQDPQQEAKLRESCEYFSISHAANIDYHGAFWAFEGGENRGHFGWVKAGDVIEVRLTAKHVPKIQYRINGKVVYTSTKETPLRLCAKVCARHQRPLVEGLQWIFEKDPAKLQTSIAELETQITQQQTQLQTSEGEKHRLKAAIEEKEAEMEALQAVVEQQKKEMKVGSEDRRAVVKENTELQAEIATLRDVVEQQKTEIKAVAEALQADIAQYQKEIKAGSDALLSVTREKADLLLQMEDERAAARIASDTKVHLQEENAALRTAIDSVEEKLRMEEAACCAAVERKNELQEQLQQREMRLQGEISALQGEISALQAASGEKVQLQDQLEEEKAALQAAITEKLELQAELEGLKAVVEQQKKEMKAQLKRESDEKVKLQVRTMQLQGENEALHAVMGELTEENAQKEVRARQLHVQEQLRRQWGQHSEASSEDWEQVPSIASVASVRGVTA